jgi:hypothetical protein
VSALAANQISAVVAFATIVLVLWTLYISRGNFATGLSRAWLVLVVGGVVSVSFCAASDQTDSHRLLLFIFAAAAVRIAQALWRFENYFLEDIKEVLATRRR